MEPRLPFRLLTNSFLLARPAGRNKWLPKAGVTGEREAAVIELGFKGVVLEAHSCIVALCPDRHFPRRAGLHVLGCIPLDSYPLRAQECWAMSRNRFRNATLLESLYASFLSTMDLGW